MKRKYEYIDKYNFRGGVGTFECTYNKQITSFLDIRKIKKFLEETQGLENVAVESYILVSKRENRRKYIK